MNKYEQMKAAAAQGKRKNGKPKLMTPLIPGMTRKGKIAAKDKEMETRGRFPEGTAFAACMDTQHSWSLTVIVPAKWEARLAGDGIHQLLTEAYEAWVKAGRPGQVVNSPAEAT